LNPVSNRTRDLAAIHAAAAKLGLDTADKDPGSAYRTILRVQGGGKASAADMTDAERRRVLAYLIKLQGPAKKAPDPDSFQAAKAKKLWAQLAVTGALKDNTEAGLKAFVKARFGVDSLRFMTALQASQLIEALKGWLARERASL
jgi:hypothetical protein